jgi:hypothetical protein
VGESEDAIRSWERRSITGLLGLVILAFTVWAGVVWNATDKVLMRVDSLVREVSADRVEQMEYRAMLERRLTIQEQQAETFKQRQNWLIEQMHAEGKNGVP